MSSAVASSSTLWAQATKEWVIPAKPKPGRKPKKDSPLLQKEESVEPDSKGRRVQNRAAQRAFRERKQSQLADLQARIQSYEQGEVERNVALQNIAKRLKEENEALRRENLSLREELRKLRPEGSPETDRKRWRDSSTPAAVETNARKRIKTDDLPALSPSSAPASAISLIHSPSSLASSPSSVGSMSSSIPNDPYSPLSFSGRSPNPSMYHSNTQQPMASLFSGFSGKTPGCNENRGPTSFDQAFDMLDCGFCSDDTPCVCRELAIQQVAARIAVSGDVPSSSPSIPNNSAPAGHLIGSLSPPEVKMESHGSVSVNSTPQAPRATVPVTSITSSSSSSILDNPPAYSPPVPLPRRRQSEQTSSNSLFPIFTTQSVASRLPRAPRSPADCSGDPSNCLACADDPFGKAFCAALGSSVQECARCPKNGSSSDFGFGACCGNQSVCGSTDSSGERGSASSGVSTSSVLNSTSTNHGETMPCNTAWAQLKSHPNIAFADLTLLAEVVARRSKCTGPRVVISPDSEMEALARRRADRRSSADPGNDDMPILLTDPHAPYLERGRGNDSPQSLTKEVMQCGRQRVTEVEAEGVRDALVMLDGQYRRN